MNHRLARALGAAVALVVVSGAITAQVASDGASDSMWKPPIDISTEGHRSDGLFITTTWFLGVLFGIMTAILAIAMVRFRAAKSTHAHYHPGDTVRDGVVGFVISTVIFLIVDGNLLVRSHIDLNEVYWRYPEDDPGVVRVEVLGQQWAWHFRYPGRDATFGTPDDVVTFNDFRVPEGKKVLLQMTSKDVIHSFFLANCRMKQDVVPGQVTRMWFETKHGTAGEYEVACAEICGFAHYQMKSRFVVMKDEDFRDWFEEAGKWSAIAHDAPQLDQQWGWPWKVSGAR